MKKPLKILIGVVLAILVLYFIIPERQIRRTKNDSIEIIAKELNIPPFVAKWMINTKVGRKSAYIFIKNKKRKKDNAERNPE